MQYGVRLRQLTQWVLSAVLVGGMLLLAWYSSSNHRTGGDDSATGRRSTADAGSSLDEDEPSEQGRLEILSMPACGDLKRSLQRLDGARDTLLKEAADGRAETARQALHDYQQAVQRVREGAEGLRSRVTPDEYKGFWKTLASEREESGEDEFTGSRFALVRALTDPDADVRWAAAEALHRNGIDTSCLPEDETPERRN